MFWLRRSRRRGRGGEVHAGAGEDRADGDERGEEERRADAHSVQMGLRAHFALVIETLSQSPHSLTQSLHFSMIFGRLFSIVLDLPPHFHSHHDFSGNDDSFLN